MNGVSSKPWVGEDELPPATLPAAYAATVTAGHVCVLAPRGGLW